MADEKQTPRIDMDRFLASPPEEVLATFQNDARGWLTYFEGALELLSEQEITQEHDQLVATMKRRTQAIHDWLDLILVYLKNRHSQE